jgi:hypothetical protein
MKRLIENMFKTKLEVTDTRHLLICVKIDVQI